MPEYEATIDRHLISKEWVIRVRYVSGGTSERRRWSSFVLVPTHQGMMFSAACEQIEPAITAHRDGRLREAFDGTSHV